MVNKLCAPLTCTNIDLSLSKKCWSVKRMRYTYQNFAAPLHS